MPLSCFNGIVGIRDLCGTRDSTVYYLDDLPGIDQASLAELRSVEQETVQKVYDKLQARAVQDVSQKAKARFLKDFEASKRPRRYTSGKLKIDCTENTIATGDYLSGQVFDMRASEYISLKILSVQIRTQGAATSKLYVIDLYTGNTIEEIDYSVTGAGIHTIDINKRYEGYERIFVAYDQRAIESLYVDKTQQIPCSVRECYTFFLDGGTVAASNIRFDCLEYGHCGIVVDYEVNCSFDLFLCANKEGLSPALWHAFGLAFWEESMVAKEITQIYLVPDEIREKAIASLKENMKEALDNWAKTVGTENVCFKQRPKTVRKVMRLP